MKVRQVYISDVFSLETDHTYSHSFCVPIFSSLFLRAVSGALFEFFAEISLATFVYGFFESFRFMGWDDEDPIPYIFVVRRRLGLKAQPTIFQDRKQGS